MPPEIRLGPPDPGPLDDVLGALRVWARWAAGIARHALATLGRSAGGVGMRLRRSGRGMRPAAARAALLTRDALRGGADRLRPLSRGLLTRFRRLPVPPPQAILIAAAGAWLLAGITWQTCGLRGCPSPARLVAYQPENAPLLLDRHGKVFTRLMPVDYRVVPVDSLPDFVPEAFVAVEDRRFWQHGGVDWARVLGAAAADLRAGGYSEGASTITMQLARNLFPKRLSAGDQTLRRKLFEARVAMGIERRFSKREILELYLNHIYFGDGAYGIDAAARDYFARSASKLTLPQAAMLAGLVRAPTHYDPREHADAAKSRRNLVLLLMARQGLADSAKVRAASERSLGVKSDGAGGRDRPFAGYYVERVRRIVEDHFGGDLYGTRLRIRTSLDPEAQRVAEEELEKQLKSIERGHYGRLHAPAYGADAALDSTGTRYLQGALVMLDAGTGDVLALIGGRDHRQSRFDRAVAGRRQVGSAFKPFVYGAALQAGFAASQPILDEPISVRLSSRRVWRPENYEGDYEGIVTMRHALIHSRNVPTVRLATAVGTDRIIDVARQAGIVDSIPEHPSMALGTASLSPLELTAAYTTFANLGTRVQPRFVLSVQDSTGEVLWDPESQRQPALDPAVAWVLTDMLRDVVDRGTGRAVRSVGYQGIAAGKTGTTSDAHDAWFVGFTPDVVAGIWIGFDQPRQILPHASGGALAAPVWGRVMRRLEPERSSSWPWSPPDRVTFRETDPATGMVLEDGCDTRYGELPVREAFIRGSVPDEVCPRRGGYGGWLSDLWGRIFGRGDRDRGSEDLDLTPISPAGRMLGARVLPGTHDDGTVAENDGGRPVRVIGTPVH